MLLFTPLWCPSVRAAVHASEVKAVCRRGVEDATALSVTTLTFNRKVWR